jgi:hypothetical protein
MFHMVMGLVSAVIVPVLLFVAWNGWFKSVREGLGPWRKGVGSAALLIFSVNWTLTVVSFVPTLAHCDSSGLASLGWASISLSQSLSLAAVLLATALRRATRIQAMLAGVLMLTFWPLGYI